jgi:hypothetical protein
MARGTTSPSPACFHARTSSRPHGRLLHANVHRPQGRRRQPGARDAALRSREYTAREAAAIDWLDTVFDDAGRTRRPGVVIGMQADMWDLTAPGQGDPDPQRGLAGAASTTVSRPPMSGSM